MNSFRHSAPPAFHTRTSYYISSARGRSFVCLAPSLHYHVAITPTFIGSEPRCSTLTTNSAIPTFTASSSLSWIHYPSRSMLYAGSGCFADAILASPFSRRHSLNASWAASSAPACRIPNSMRPKTPNYAQRNFSGRRTPRACHGGCDPLRPGSLRASHAVCLAARTLEPVFCARKEGADIECVSTIESILTESLVMQRDLSDNQAVSFGFYATSRHGIPRLSPRNFNLNEITANNGAAENCSARHGSCYSYPGVSRSSRLLS